MSVMASRRSKTSGQWIGIALLVLSVGFLVVSALIIYSWQQDQHWKNAGLSELQTASQQHPNDVRILRNLALRLEQQGQYPEAFDAFTRAAAADSGDEIAWLGAARLTDRLYGNQGALDLLSVYLKQHPRSASAHLALAELYLEFRAHRRVWEEATAVLSFSPNNADALRLAGIAEMSMNRLPDAEKSLRQAVALAPRDWQASFALAGLLVGLHKNEEAETVYRQTTALAPSEAMPHLLLAKLLLDVSKTPTDLQKARQEAADTVALNPNTPGGYLLLGQIDARLLHWADAQEDLLRAKQHSPLEPTVAYELARAYQRQGDSTNAAQEMARFRRLSNYLAQKRLLIERLSQQAGPEQLAQNESDPTTRLKLARLATDNGDTFEAIRQYRLLLAKNLYTDIARQELARLAPR